MEINEEQLKQIMAILNEETVAGGTGADANATGIATSDEHIEFETLYQQTATPSLAKTILANKPLAGPTGAIFNIRKKIDADELELLRSNVECFASEPIKTNITTEALQDIKASFGQDGIEAVAVMMRGLANEAENVKLLEFLETNASLDVNTFQLAGTNARDSYFELTQRVSESVLKMNVDAVKTFRASVLLPYKLAASVMGYTGNTKLPTVTSYYVGGTELHDYYINPDPNAETIYVILHDKYDGSKGAGVYAPYQNLVKLAVDSSNGEYVYFIYNRYALGISPLHTEDAPSIMKFDYYSV